MNHLLLILLEAYNKTQNNSVMDETETPENDDFRDPESDC